MKKKLGTILDEELVFKAKQVALSQEQSLSKILEDALKMYLLTIDRKKVERKKDISQSTYGAMSVSKTVLKAVMKEEGVYETG
ncbi:MAG: hypothetical protein AB1488_05435 [Nitrospirota bacterium]